jgi:hypothetical protein
MITTIIYIVIALCLIGTVIWAFQTYVTIPGPFAWVKGLITFALVVVACYFLWDTLIAQHVMAPGPGRHTRIP